jgi:cytochrome c556
MKNDPGRTQVLADGQRALAQTLHAWRKDPKAAERTDELNAGIKAVLKSCRTCHDEFRGHSSRK